MKRPIPDDLKARVNQPLPHVVSHVEDWPIYALSRDKDQFLQDVAQKTQREFLAGFDNKKSVHSALKHILYQEKIRLTQTPWKSDTPEERKFWSDVKRRILHADNLPSNKERFAEDKELLSHILSFYTQEIVAHFDVKAYRTARVILPWLYGRLMNASPTNTLRFLSSSGKSIHDKLRITGEVEHIRNLATKGTLVVVPTHFSNLDSPTIGLVLEFMGLPAMTYGAGINLFTVKLLSYMMNNLGAYKVDRRRKNSLYLNVLKNYSTVALQRGAHSLFFPGGTRSRSGAIETKLKLGLLGTAVEAQRLILAQYPEETARKIYIVPVTLNYHFVLEAKNLIQQHLSMHGREEFLSENDQPSTSYRIAKLFYKFLTATPGMTVSFGAPMDVLGNEVNEAGESIDRYGNALQLSDYFSFKGQLREDAQRDAVYTRHLGEALVSKFYRYNTVLSSHLMAFTAFEMMRGKFPHFSLYQLLRLPEDEAAVPYTEFALVVDRLRNRLIELYQGKRLLLAPQFFGPVEKLIEHGLKNMGVYHAKRVLHKADNSHVATEDMQLLYYYHNRLNGYDLEEYV